MKLILASLVLAFASTPALADRAPTDRERAALERVLRDAGYQNWEDIELDDDGPLWDVDDARASDGQRYDLKIDPRSVRIVRRQLDR